MFMKRMTSNIEVKYGSIFKTSLESFVQYFIGMLFPKKVTDKNNNLSRDRQLTKIKFTICDSEPSYSITFAYLGSSGDFFRNGFPEKNNFI